MTQKLTYRGDLRNVDLSGIIGKNSRTGARITARSVTYDEDSDTSTITLKGITPDEYRKLLEPLVRQGQDRERIRGLFNG